MPLRDIVLIKCLVRFHIFTPGVLHTGDGGVVRVRNDRSVGAVVLAFKHSDFSGLLENLTDFLRRKLTVTIWVRRHYEYL